MKNSKNNKKNKNNPPIVEIEECSFEESSYKRREFVWTAKSLYKEAELEKLTPFEYPLASFDLSKLGFRLDDIFDFIYQVKRVMNVDTSIPIIFDNEGQLADGYHRVCRALLDGKATIKAYRLKKMPDYDHRETVE